MANYEKLKNSEKEKKIKETINLVTEQRTKEQEKIQDSRLETPEFVNGRVNDLPQELKEDMIEISKRFELFGLNGEQIKQTMDEVIKYAEASYTDKRFEMSNKSYAKMQMVKFIDDLFRETPKLEDLKCIARISFDLNGLKPVNDLTKSHEQGDEYLKIVASALKKKGPQNWLKDYNVKILATADGGDEFGVILKGEEELTSVILNEFIKMIKEEVRQDKKADKILDFSKKQIRLSFAGISEKEFSQKTPSEQEEILAQVKIEIPKNFKYRAEISAGAATLYDCIEQAQIGKEDKYNRSLEKIMGAIFDLSDKNMQESKEAFKKKLETSDSPEDQMMLKIYSRTEAERRAVRLEQLNNRKDELFKDQIILLKKSLNESKLALEGGLKEEDVLEQMAKTEIDIKRIETELQAVLSQLEKSK